MPCFVGPPSNVKTAKTTRSSATLTWTKPLYNGGDDVISYTIEFAHVKKEGDDAEIGDWTKCNLPSQYLLTEYTLTDLAENQKYKIR